MNLILRDIVGLITICYFNREQNTHKISPESGGHFSITQFIYTLFFNILGKHIIFTKC